MSLKSNVCRCYQPGDGNERSNDNSGYALRKYKSIDAAILFASVFGFDLRLINDPFY